MKRSMEIERPPKPIFSTYAADPDLDERIDSFVIQMGERIDHLQDIEIDGDLVLLRELSEKFASESRELGYEPLARAAERLPVDIDAVLPVPLHWRRKALRGFNQAEELSRPLVRERSLPVLRGIVRRRRTRYQSGLTPRQRDSNLSDAFVVKRPPTARHVLIVDDVITTGATTRHLARALHNSGVSRISALAVARAVPVRQRQPD